MEQAPDRTHVAVLLFSIFAVAVCGLTYELLTGAVASYLLGNSVQWFSLTIGAFMSAMGLGAWLSRLWEDELLEKFIAVEIAVGITGAIGGPVLFAAYTWTKLYTLVMFVFIGLIGVGVGLEIPLLTRYLEGFGNLKKAISDVMAFDYLGALVAAVLFPMVLLPYLGLLKTFPAVGLLNLLVACGTAFVFKERLKGANALMGASVAGMVVSVGILVGAEGLMSRVEQSLYQDEVIYAEQSAYQRIVLTRHQDDTRLYLDGHLQLSSRDEYRYHESLVHPAMSLAASREHVLVMGGGDGMAVREVLRHPDVKQVTLVDLDPVMTKLGVEHPLLTEMSGSALSDPRVTIVHEDAYTYLENTGDTWPVILMDFPDPHGEALTKLYSVAFYRLLDRHLSPGGVAVTQSTSPYFARDAFWCVVASAEAAGLKTRPYHAWVPSFGEWGFTMMGHGPLDTTRIEAPEGAKWLNQAAVDTMFVFPSDMSKTDVEANTIDDPVILQYYTTSWSKWF